MTDSSPVLKAPKPGARRIPYRRIIFGILIFACSVLLLSSSLPDQHEIQPETEPALFPCPDDGPVRRVAVIGAGSAGSSTAYHLHKATHGCAKINITVYERDGYVGGRSTTVNVYGDLHEPVELGASIFVNVNQNLVSAVKELNLSTGTFKGDDDNLPDTLGIYDGTKMVFILGDDWTGGWWTMGKVLLRYGLAPIKTQRLMKRVVERFLKMYTSPVFPFDDLATAVEEVGLLETVGMTGMGLLLRNGISDSFAREIVQASTRVNYAQDLETIHGVESMVCMATDGAMSVHGGNWQIFDGMLRASHASVRLNTSVNEISMSGETGEYVLSASTYVSTTKKVVQTTEMYDTIVLAAPLQFTNITFSPALSQSSAPESIPYVALYVTLFTSPHKLDALHFGLPADSIVPNTILTTTPPPSSSDPSAPTYYSISTLRLLRNPKTGEPEYLYKIFSSHPLSPEYLYQNVLGGPFYCTLEGTCPEPGFNNNNNDSTQTWHERDFGWVHTKVWNSYPIESPRTTFDSIILDQEHKESESIPDQRMSSARGIYYTSGIESFISTMETSSLMGKNVATLIVKKWLEESEGSVGMKANNHGASEL